MFRAGRTQILVFHAPCLCERISQYQANEFVNYKSLQTFSFFLTLFLPTFFLRVYPFYLDCLPPLIFSVCVSSSSIARICTVQSCLSDLCEESTLDFLDFSIAFLFLSLFFFYLLSLFPVLDFYLIYPFYFYYFFQYPKM